MKWCNLMFVPTHLQVLLKKFTIHNNNIYIDFNSNSWMGVYTEELKMTFSYIMIIYYTTTHWSHTQLYHVLSMISDKDFSRSFLINQKSMNACVMGT